MNKKSAYIAALFLSTSAISAPAFAQTLATTPPDPEKLIDGNGVDIISGLYYSQQEPIAVGDAANGIADDRLIYGGSYLDTLYGYANVTSSTGYPEVLVNGQTLQFTMTTGGVYVPRVKNGYTLSRVNNVLTLTAPNGTIYQFGGPSPVAYQSYFGLSKVIYPTGKILTYYYRTTVPSGGPSISRIQSIVSNTGYQAKFLYQRDATPAVVDISKWQHALMVTVFNQLADPCDVNANSCALSKSYPQLAISTLGQNPTVYEDSDWNDTTFSLDSRGNINGVALPDHVGNNINIQYGTTPIDDHYGVSSVSLNLNDASPPQTLTTAYTFSLASGIRTVTATTGSRVNTYKVDTNNDEITYYKDGAGNVTTYQYDTDNRIEKITYPELNFTEFGYDDRGNLISTIAYPKPGSSLSPIQTSATYPSTCANIVTCNEPSATTDANGNTTNYTYDLVHGGVLTITKPAAVAGGVRPQTRYSYVRLDENGAPSSSGIFVVSSISTCKTQASCSGSADETVTSYTYGRNLLPMSVSVSAGDGSVSSVTNYTYDDIGNLIAVDGPLAGSADTTQMAYSKSRRLVASLSADPDGAGSLSRRAQRMTYSSLEKLSKIEIGTAASISSTGLDNMSVSQVNTITYDAIGRKLTDVLSSGSVTYGVTQYSYDGLNRLDCVAMRMNSSTWGTLPSSACTPQTTGAAGPDRITKNTVYDADDRPTSVTTAYGQTYATTESTAFTPNGKVASVTDGNNNMTSYGYDGFDRLSTTTYPGGSYEQLGYDANGNVTSLRRRDGSSIGYTYDHLNRMTFEDRVNQGIDEDVTTNYDLLGHLTYTSTPHGHKTAFGYDALGRRVSETTTYGGVKTSMYDAAGRRTRLTWPDGFYVSYDYDTLGEMTAVRENGATSGVGVLATYAYDDLGNRKSITRGNGVTTTYGYDPVSRLTSLVHDLAGTASDESASFTYNPAGQIASRTSSNDAYAWNGAVNVNRAYTTNALNQYTASGGVVLGYDANGNLTSSGSSTYAYGQHNQLWSVAGATLYYDPLDRLDVILDNVTNPTFDYDGANLATERTYGSSTITRRYVFGADVDEPLVWYEGSGTSDRRWLIADERGSVIAVTDGSGNATAINTYDEYGIPGANNQGRFQYTGQIWLPQLGMYYYKARMYSPSLGRFMQTDPIGYADGLNWYNYVGGDPINGVDPTGLDDNDPPANPGPPPPDIEVYGPPIGPIFFFTGGDGQFVDTSHSEEAGRWLAAQPSVAEKQLNKKGRKKGNPSAKDIADLKKRMIEACAASQSSAECFALKEQLRELEQEFNRNNPLPIGTRNIHPGWTGDTVGTVLDGIACIRDIADAAESDGGTLAMPLASCSLTGVDVYEGLN